MNKKKNLKPAFILCLIVAAAIIALFYSASKVNEKVADNLGGKMLYSTKDKDVFYLYNIDEDKEYKISGVSDAILYDDDNVIVKKSGEEGIYKYNPGNSDMTLIDKYDGILMDMAYENGILMYLTDNNGKSTICSYDFNSKKTATELSSEDEITDICISPKGKLFYTVKKDNSYSVYSDNELVTTENNEICNINTDDKNLVYDSEGKVYIFNLSGKSTSTPSFCKDNAEYSNLIIVHDKLYIVNESIDENSIYVCNGSNMDKFDKLSQTNGIFLEDYCEKSK